MYEALSTETGDSSRSQKRMYKLALGRRHKQEECVINQTWKTVYETF